jgi:signal transduction histidine kinase
MMGSGKRDFFTQEEIHFFEAAAETFAVALSHQEAQWALGERVKELTCLYGIAKVLQRADLPLEDLLQEIVGLLPPGWQYPEVTQARITLDGRDYPTPGFRETAPVQTAEIVAGGRVRGRVEVAYSSPMPPMDEGPFLKEERNLIDAVAETLGVALGHRAAQWALGERVKELTCLYAIARDAQRPGPCGGDLLRQIAGHLPPGWQYPDCARARIVLDGESFSTPGFRETTQSLSAPLVVDGRERGFVEVVYTEEKPPSGEGPFLREERSLIDEVARQVGLLIENCEAEEEKARLQEQLRHADRLATIGQLSAGAAHELNEPLGSILGFAQLAKECAGVPRQAMQDLDRIANAALHAREVIRKLMLFARQVPTQKAKVNLNKLVREGLYFLESRCAREGIRIERSLDEALPAITADEAQMHQILVNLVVNAVQAMPGGGTLTLSTRADGPAVRLAVKDTGTGMSDPVLKQIFLPFFTTKDVGQGTGLGLSVVHGIVSAHGGTISVESQPGLGSRFEVTLPVEAVADSEETS